MSRTLLNAGLMFVLGLAGAGCAASGPIYVDSGFTASEQAAVEAAAESWRAHGAQIDLVYGAKVTGFDGSRRELVRTNRRGAAGITESIRTADGRHLHMDISAIAAGEEDIIVAMDAVLENGDSLQAVVAHEMGHLLGLGHLGPESLMAEVRGTASPVEPTAEDIRGCVAVGGCVGSGHAEESSPE